MFAEELAQLANRLRLLKDEKLIDETKTPEEIYKANLARDPTAALDALTASLTNLQTAASAPAMKTAASAISSVADALQSLAGAAADHPKTAMAIGGGVGAAALGGAGWMSNQIATGFGLPAVCRPAFRRCGGSGRRRSAVGGRGQNSKFSSYT